MQEKHGENKCCESFTFIVGQSDSSQINWSESTLDSGILYKKKIMKIYFCQWGLDAMINEMY